MEHRHNTFTRITGWVLCILFVTAGALRPEEVKKPLFSYHLQAKIALQYIGLFASGDSSSQPIPLSFRYDDPATLAGMNVKLYFGQHITVEEDIHFRIKETLFFQRDQTHNIIDDLGSFNSDIFRRSCLRYQRGNLSVTCGRDRLRFGPGKQGNLVISDNIPFYDLIGLKYRIVNGSYDFFITKINHDQSPRFLTFHRIEFPVKGILKFGLAEANLVHADLYDFANFNPVMVYHNVDRKSTNYMFGADVVFGNKWWKVYAELGMDDILWNAIEAGAKAPTAIAYQAGAFVSGIGGKNTLSISAEFTHVDRYMYITHPKVLMVDTLSFLVNRLYPEVTNCLGDPGIIGYWTGPNAQNAHLSLEYSGIKKLKVSAGYEFLKQGDRDFAGNEKYLAGVLTKRHLLSLRADFKVLKYADITGRYSYGSIKNYHFQHGNNFSVQELEFKTTFSFSK